MNNNQYAEHTMEEIAEARNYLEKLTNNREWQFVQKIIDMPGPEQEKVEHVANEVYTRTVGFFRPLSRMNPGIREMHKQMKKLNVKGVIEEE